ncbi:BglG family transcription antiterminator [Ornithinibacillus bavariensis]|uniref:Ascorbate-specific PTS system EIIA component n=1 Tax=Ornithinibacillus bavariensis TaxID=545502 RepID=A0A919XAA5_9BACI|nr:BglG family transcription antiterminator [Ornithinibacillus bavariensis]GIO27005.1 PTS sugar transporter subunit IIA [Ornithinibacillus bavariensis]HAM80080.1 transcription antiterminator BglG [Ornithinibacillus sp.]
MILSDRYKRILDDLMSYPSMTSMELERKYSLTRRQLGYGITKINEWLKGHDLPAIERTRQGHFVIDQAILTKLCGNWEAISKKVNRTILREDERVHFILMMLLSSEEELSLNHFTYELDVSKNTVLNDLKQAQTYVHEYNIVIRYSRKFGYVLEGKEFQIRKLLMYMTFQILQLRGGESWLQKIANIKADELNEFKLRVEKVENQLNLKFTDEKHDMMPYVLILLLRRIKKGHQMEAFSIEYEELSNTKEYKATEELLYDMEDIPLSDRLFITLHILTTNIFSSEILEDDLMTNLLPAIDNMLRHFEKSACVYLRDRDQLLDKLLQHLKPAYYRIKYHLTDTILFQGSLSREFKELHHLVKRSIGPLRELIGSEIPDNEIAFITMLIGGWMDRQGESIDKKVKAVVVCPQGISVSRLMFNELRELFPEFIFLDFLSVREFLKYPLEYDVIFSPINLETNKKLFVTKAFLGKEEKYRLRKQVMLGIHGYVPESVNIDYLLELIANYATIHQEAELKQSLVQYLDLNENGKFVTHHYVGNDLNLEDLINPDTITLVDSVDSWETAIRLGANPLLKKGIIEPRYVDAMLRYCEEDSYIVIAPGVAIPHAAPDDGAKQVGMSFLRIRDGVSYTNDYDIYLIIAISAVDKQQHIHALMQLMNLVGSEKECNKLINANSVQEIVEIIQHYSKD